MVSLLFGTYTDVTHLVRFNPPNGSSPPTLERVKDLDIPRASWITRHPQHSEIFYIAHEVDDGGGTVPGVEGKVWVYRNTPDGDATRLGEVSAAGNPCHVEVVGGGTALAVASFAAGTAILVPLNHDGTFRSAGDNNYFKLASSDESPSRFHQCVDVPSKGECWIVDTAAGCLRKMRLSKDPVNWETKGQVDVLAGNGPRQAVVSQDGNHLYTLHARSCLVTHHDLTIQDEATLVSTHDTLPAGFSIDMNNRTPPFTFGAALNLHAASSTLIATSRFLKGADVDSVAFLKVDEKGSIVNTKIIQPKRGREFRGVGIVGDCYLVAGQHNGWLSCFQWDEDSHEWKEREFESPVKFEKVVDIESF